MVYTYLSCFWPYSVDSRLQTKICYEVENQYHSQDNLVVDYGIRPTRHIVIYIINLDLIHQYCYDILIYSRDKEYYKENCD